jgi:hypothetical protein
MYAREEAASTIVALLYELSKQLIRNPAPKSIKVTVYFLFIDLFIYLFIYLLIYWFIAIYLFIVSFVL